MWRLPATRPSGSGRSPSDEADVLALHDEVEQAATRVDDQSDKRSGGHPVGPAGRCRTPWTTARWTQTI